MIQVLLLDADNTPLADPTALFDAPAFVEAGALFWADYWLFDRQHTANEHFYLAANATRPSQEAGQLLIDKRRGWGALQLVCFLSSDGRERFYHDEAWTTPTVALAAAAVAVLV